jgi:hypothetical protein
MFTIGIAKWPLYKDHHDHAKIICDGQEQRCKDFAR